MAAGGEFVEGWLVAQVLGEGSYGEVRLLVHARSGACVALKAVRGEAAGGAAGGAREAALHRVLRHPHVLRCMGERLYADRHYLFLEYAQGGELFDRIEPDAGMAPAAARRYWRQLLAGLRYLHSRGVAHRDIKPENLLLDAHDNLKISDFGMATVFRQGTRERLLGSVCGTLPYAAPEVLEAARRPYRAPPADVWSAAVVLHAMLLGELPWERACRSEARYAAWCATCEAGGEGAGGAWRRLSAEARALLRLALDPQPTARPSLSRLLLHRWTSAAPLHHEPPHRPAAEAEGAGGARREWCSQPAGAAEGARDVAPGEAEMRTLLSLSQPAHPDELLVSPTEGELTQRQGVLQRLVRRMTRVWVSCSEERALQELRAVLAARGYRWRELHPRLLAVDCGGELRLRVWAVRAAPAGAEGEARVMLEFRRSRGCGLQFKRCFLELRAALGALAVPPPTHALHVPLDAPLDAPLDGPLDAPLDSPLVPPPATDAMDET